MIRNLLALFIVFTSVSVVFSQNIEWDRYEVGGGNLQKMNVVDEDTAFIAGYDRTFLRSVDAGETWEKIPLITSSAKFLDFSFVGDTGYLIGNRGVVVDHVSKNGYSDVYANGAILKYIAGEWSILDISNVGDGDNPAKNPNASGCGEIDFMAVETLNESTAFIGVRWNDYNSGQKVIRTGVFKTEDGGNAWNHIFDTQGLFITTILLNGEVGYIAGLKLFAKTIDTGITFTNLFPELEKVADNNIYIQDITWVSSSELYLTTTSDGILYSSDGATSFEKLSDLGGGNDFLKIDQQTMIVAGTSSKAKITIDGGTNWESFGPGYTTYEVIGPWNDSLYFLGKSNMAIIALTDLKNKSTDAFRSIEMSAGNNLNKVHIFNNDEAFLCANGGVLLETRDRGKDWSFVSIPELPVNGANFDFISLSTSSEGTGYLGARRLRYVDFPSSSPLKDLYQTGVMFKTKNNWKNWDVYNAKLIGALYSEIDENPAAEGCYMFEAYASHALNDSVAFVFGSWKDTISSPGSDVGHSRVFRTSDDGLSWEIVSEDLGSSIIEVITFKNDIGFVGGNKVLLKTADTGKTFVDVFENFGNNTEGKGYIVDITMETELDFWITTTSNGLFKTNDGGESFVKMEGVSGANDFVALNDKTFFMAGSSTKTQYSQDSGNSWISSSIGTTIWELGPIWNDKVFALTKGAIYSTDIMSFELTDAIEDILADVNNPLRIVSYSSTLDVYSNESVIEQCVVYNSLGQRVAAMQPNSNAFQINSAEFNSGVYIVVAISGNEKFTQKVMVK